MRSRAALNNSIRATDSAEDSHGHGASDGNTDARKFTPSVRKMLRPLLD